MPALYYPHKVKKCKKGILGIKKCDEEIELIPFDLLDEAQRKKLINLEFRCQSRFRFK